MNARRFVNFVAAIAMFFLSIESLTVTTTLATHVWVFEHQVVETPLEGNLIVFFFDYDNNMLSSSDTNAVLAHLSDQLVTIGVRTSVPMSMSMNSSKLRLTMRSVAAAVRSINYFNFKCNVLPRYT